MVSVGSLYVTVMSLIAFWGLAFLPTIPSVPQEPTPLLEVPVHPCDKHVSADRPNSHHGADAPCSEEEKT